jgi:hypothetical protein
MVYTNPYGKSIITIEVIEDGLESERFETFASEMPFYCKQCNKPILYCYLTTDDDEHKNQEWLSQPFTAPSYHPLASYLGKISPLTCTSSECLGPNGVPILEFYIQNLICVADTVADTVAYTTADVGQ